MPTDALSIDLVLQGTTSLLKKVTSLVSDSVGKMTDTLKASDLAPLDGALKRLSSAATDSSRAALNSLSAAVKVSVQLVLLIMMIVFTNTLHDTRLAAQQFFVIDVLAVTQK